MCPLWAALKAVRALRRLLTVLRRRSLLHRRPSRPFEARTALPTLDAHLLLLCLPRARLNYYLFSLDCWGSSCSSTTRIYDFYCTFRKKYNHFFPRRFQWIFRCLSGTMFVYEVIECFRLLPPPEMSAVQPDSRLPSIGPKFLTRPHSLYALS